jgi:hypothetical protein
MDSLLNYPGKGVRVFLRQNPMRFDHRSSFLSPYPASATVTCGILSGRIFYF